MKGSILRITEKGLILIEDEPQETGSVIEFDIRLPQDALIDNLPLKGTIIKSEAVEHHSGIKYLHEIEFLGLAVSDKLILKAYIKFLEREKLIDELYTHGDLKSLTENLKECNEEIIERLALLEFTYAKTKKITFH